MESSNTKYKSISYFLKKLNGIAPVIQKDFSGIEFLLPKVLIENHSSVISRLGLIWQDPVAAKNFLNEISIKDRDGRNGFSLEASREIFFLQQLNEFLYKTPQILKDTGFSARLDYISRPRNIRELIQRNCIDIVSPEYLAALRNSEKSRICGWREISSMEELRSAVLSPPKRTSWEKIGSILTSGSIASEEIINNALAIQRNDNRFVRIGEILKSEFNVCKEDIEKAASLQSGFLVLHLDRIPITHEAFSTVPEYFVREYGLLPVLRIGGKLVIAFEEPHLMRSFKAVRAIENYTKLSVVMAWVPSEAFDRRIMNYRPNFFEKGM